MKSLATLIEQATGTSPLACYQCGRCSAGCEQNLPDAMDLSPNRLMHLVQMEHAFRHQPSVAASYAERILKSEAIWMCLSCQLCSQRCPQGIDIAAAMDVLRCVALERRQYSASPRVRRLINSHRAFLSNLKRCAHSNEVALVSEYKMRSGDLFTDVTLAPPMLLKGKLSPRDAALGTLSLLTRRPSPAMRAVLDAAETLKQSAAEESQP